MGLEVCSPWATVEQMCAAPETATDCVDGDVTLEYLFDDDALLFAASNLLYARTGYRWPGVCDRSAWPCISGCHSDVHPCAPCFTRHSFRLPTDYPVIEITSITEDGVELDASKYRLERGNVVMRLDTLPWQLNTFGLPYARGVETIVTYTTGKAPPVPGDQAAAALALELKKSCNGESCALPANVTHFARRGVEVEITDLAEMLKSGATGIPIVDHFLAVYGDLKGAPTMFDPARGYRGMPTTP